MTIITVTKKGTLKLPKEVLAHLGGSQHLQVRLVDKGVNLVAVQIQTSSGLKGIPKG